MSQPWANHQVPINRLFFPSIICVSSPSLCSPPSHHHGRKNTHVKFPGPAAILRCWLLCQNPNLGKVKANPARLCFAASCPTCYCSSQHPARGMCHVGPSLSSRPASSSTAGAKSGSDIGGVLFVFPLPWFFKEIKTTWHLVALYCCAGLCHVFLPQSLFALLITSEPT